MNVLLNICLQTLNTNNFGAQFTEQGGIPPS
jgi:hypothetical protein